MFHMLGVSCLAAVLWPYCFELSCLPRNFKELRGSNADQPQAKDGQNDRPKFKTATQEVDRLYMEIRRSSRFVGGRAYVHARHQLVSDHVRTAIRGAAMKPERYCPAQGSTETQWNRNHGVGREQGSTKARTCIRV
ncbi:hypothetical protein DFH08DRAFT_368472 [Mycena albidolilacea]|uniref:Secreted protein n=1 Tax=Mycena albidolilacea TaxID=1033008 RepID=A0AAD7AKE1_9AGAR|nr:hypothetical protein DFH08DRAFT_368472 [Mycena albidolilacea]